MVSDDVSVDAHGAEVPMRTRLTAVLVPLLVLAMGLVGTAAAAPPDDRTADVIVVLHDDVDSARAAQQAARDHGAEVSFVYRTALRGYAAVVPRGRLDALQRDPGVDYVQANGPVSIQAQAIPTGVRRIFADDNPNLRIDGIDERVDVDVAVIDTGIDVDHPDLNVVAGVTCSESGRLPWTRTATCETGGDDDHYHGTHVAGTIGALDNGIGVVGVAPGARLHAVKVLSSNGSGSEAMVVAGIDWVAANASTIEVANMSLGGSGHSQAEYDAIQGAVDAGVAFAVAAGNDDDDADNYSPGGFDNVLSVSALADFDGEPGGLDSTGCRTDQDDTLADFSNWGPEVDVAAPGVCIRSTYPLEQGEYGTISGTSMASPHVAGALALLASNGFTRSAGGVQSLYDEVTGSGNLNWTDESGDGTQEPLLDVSRFTATHAVGGNIPPTATFAHECTDLSCTFDGSGSSDGDGTISSYAWDFGDDGSATGPTPSHTYGAAGTYTVVLTITDDDGATDTAQQDVTVTEPPAAGEFSLSTSGWRDKGRHQVDLAWDDTGATSYDVLLDGAPVATVAATSYTWSSTNRGGGTYTFRVCEAGTDTCSNTSTVAF